MLPEMKSTHVCGLDVCGEVHSIGEGVVGFVVGERVIYHGNMFKPHGGFAEYAVHAAETTIRLSEISVFTSAADPVVLAATPCAALPRARWQ